LKTIGAADGLMWVLPVLLVLLSCASAVLLTLLGAAGVLLVLRWDGAGSGSC
jgi:hypothetical protein